MYRRHIATRSSAWLVTHEPCLSLRQPKTMPTSAASLLIPCHWPTPLQPLDSVPSPFRVDPNSLAGPVSVDLRQGEEGGGRDGAAGLAASHCCRCSMASWTSQQDRDALCHAVLCTHSVVCLQAVLNVLERPYYQQLATLQEPSGSASQGLRCATALRRLLHPAHLSPKQPEVNLSCMLCKPCIRDLGLGLATAKQSSKQCEQDYGLPLQGPWARM